METFIYIAFSFLAGVVTAIGYILWPDIKGSIH